MNSLPPELISSIIESAAECNSLYDSYKGRQSTLSALSLVNRTFRSFAQPLLAQKVYLRKPQKLEDLLGSTICKHATTHFTYNTEASSSFDISTIRFVPSFTNLKEMRLVACRGISLATFTELSNLTKLCIQNGHFNFDPERDVDLSLLGVVELTLQDVYIRSPRLHTAGTPPLLLSQNHFPALRTLGLFDLLGNRGTVADVSSSLLAQLDCFATDDSLFRSCTSPFSTPVLIDIIWYDPTPSLTKARLRIRSPRHEVDRALVTVRYLLVNSPVLKELYLEFFDGNGSTRHDLDRVLAEKIRRMENIAREKKVEIIWENQTDDWCRGRVSREFWRRSREQKK